mmetsp:Transcript_24351/g.33804  ORF Transcript_24351/g.33804 Transcript_24351/m.33804 type:complete len:275 (+) Transcript_24351:656-1480(+)
MASLSNNVLSTPYSFFKIFSIFDRRLSSSSTQPDRCQAGNPFFSSSLPWRPLMMPAFLRSRRARRAISPMYSPETSFSVKPRPLLGDAASTSMSYLLYTFFRTRIVGESKFPHSILMHIVASGSASLLALMYLGMFPTFSQYATLKPVPMITPSRARSSLKYSVTRVPTVSLSTAVTPMLTPSFLNCSARRAQTSLPTTPAVVKLFVHRTRIPEFSEFFFIGKENVKPRGALEVLEPLINFATDFAMKPNRPSASPPTTCLRGIRYLAALVSTT